LKSLDTADAPGSALAAFRPSHAEHFALVVAATIGPANGSGGELFQFNARSPSWHAAENRPKGFAFERALVVDRWTAELVERAIADLCRRTEGDTWQEIAQRLSRYAEWESEDYCERR
jgi:hypothetical protein